MSSKTRKANVKKIKSGHKGLVALLLPILGIALVFVLYWNRSEYELHRVYFCSNLAQTTPEKSCDTNLEVAESATQKARGLSGRTSLSEGEGMIFPYSRVGNYCMWMQDMRISIDIIWLDTNNQIVKIEPNISPDTYPKEFCSDKGINVVELPAGKAQTLKLKEGDFVSTNF